MVPALTKGLRAQNQKSGTVPDRLTRWCCELTRILPSGAVPFAAQKIGQRKKSMKTPHQSQTAEARTAKVARNPKVNKLPADKLAVVDAVHCWQSIEQWKNHPRHILLMFADSLERQAKVARFWAEQKHPMVNTVSMN